MQYTFAFPVYKMTAGIFPLRAPKMFYILTDKWKTVNAYETISLQSL